MQLLVFIGLALKLTVLRTSIINSLADGLSNSTCVGCMTNFFQLFSSFSHNWNPITCVGCMTKFTCLLFIFAHLAFTLAMLDGLLKPEKYFTGQLKTYILISCIQHTIVKLRKFAFARPQFYAFYSEVFPYMMFSVY